MFIGLGMGTVGISTAEDRWMFNSDPEAVPGVNYKMIVAATSFVVADCFFKL